VESMFFGDPRNRGIEGARRKRGGKKRRRGGTKWMVLATCLQRTLPSQNTISCKTTDKNMGLGRGGRQKGGRGASHIGILSFLEKEERGGSL